MTYKSDSTGAGIDRETVIRLARLARLSLSESEISAYQQDLTAILAFIDQLRAATVSDIEPVYHVGQPAETSRPDAITDPDPVSFPVGSDLIARMPTDRIIDGHFKVPRIL